MVVKRILCLIKLLGEITAVSEFLNTQTPIKTIGFGQERKFSDTITKKIFLKSLHK